MIDADLLSILGIVPNPRAASRQYGQVIADRPHDIVDILKLKTDNRAAL
jgi:hypothetical protein